jgi:hypothetical protein
MAGPLMARPLFSRILVSASACLLVAGVTGWSLLLASGPPVPPRQPRPPGYWFKGNTHTHSLRSDGDSTPDQVVQWYRDHDYDFLVLTDHNVLSPAGALNAKYGADRQFLVIQGEEVTDSYGSQPIHVNALGNSETVAPQHGTSVVEVMERDVAAIQHAGGLALLDHPNYVSPIGAEALRQVAAGALVEIFNGHPATNTFGRPDVPGMPGRPGVPGMPGMEAVWDRILSSGRLMYGVADDDAHVFKSSDPQVPGPGRGWVYVHAESLTTHALLEALSRGDFYASTGVELSDLQVTATGVAVEIREKPSRTYRIQFIGQNGRVLEETSSTCASYAFRDTDTYVRVRVKDSNGAFAWTQPVFRHGTSPN